MHTDSDTIVLVSMYGVHQNFTYHVERFEVYNSDLMPTSVAARFKAWVYGHSLAEIVGSNPDGGMDFSLCWVLCFVR